MTACRDALARVPGYVAGALPVEEAAQVREHLAACPDCRAAAESEAGLQRGLSRATAEPGSAGHVRDLLGQARARFATGAPPRRHRWPKVLVAALLLLAAGMGLMVALGPPCLRGGCPTMHMLLDAVAQRPTDRRQPAPEDPDVPSVPGLQAIGVGEVRDIAGPVPVAYFSKDGTELLVFRSPDAHTHFWQVERLADGREYVDRTVDGRSVIGWVDDAGRVWCCVGSDRSRALALALDVRQRTS